MNMFRALLSVVVAMSIASVSLAQTAASKTAQKTQMEARRVHHWLQEHPEIAEKIIRSVQQRRDRTEAPASPAREGRGVRSRSRSRSDDRDKAKAKPSSSEDRREQFRKRIEAWRQGVAKRIEESRKSKPSARVEQRKTSARPSQSRRGHSSRSRSRSDDRDKAKAKPSSSDDRREQIRKRIEAWRQGHSRSEVSRSRSGYSRSRSGSYRGGRSSDERREQFRENIRKFWEHIGRRIKEARAKREQAAEAKARSQRTYRGSEKAEPRGHRHGQEVKRQGERRQRSSRRRR